MATAVRRPQLVHDATFGDILREAEKLRDGASHLEESLDALVAALVNLRSNGNIASSVTPIQTVRHPIKRRKFDDPSFRVWAEPGVGALDIRPHDRRLARVSIDGAAPFLLPIRAAGLLRDLAAGIGESGDDFVPFSRIVDLAAERRCAPHAVTMAIERLRGRLLRDGHVSPLLVETRAGAARVRLRRG